MSNYRNIELVLVIFGSIVCLPLPCSAYFGPGAGLTILGGLWAVIGAVIVLIAGIFLWPLKVLIKRLKDMPKKKKGLQAIQSNIKKQDN